MRAPYQRHSDTSAEAAAEIEKQSDTLRGDVYRFLCWDTQGAGATDDEMQYALEMDPSTQRPRRVELVRMGLVRDSGMVRKTRKGRNATVWVVNR